MQSKFPTWIDGFLIAVATLTAGHRAWLGQSADGSCYARENCDGLIFRVATEMLASGRSPYDTTERLAYIQQHYLDGQPPPWDLVYQYPPTAIPSLWPRLFGDPIVTGVLITIATTGLALMAFTRWTQPGWHRVVLLLIAGFWPPALMHNWLMQSTALSTALCLGALLLVRSRPIMAGLALALAMGKPHHGVAVAIALLAAREFKAFTVGVVGTLGIIGATLIGWGPSLWQDWLVAARAPNDTAIYMVNLAATLERAGVDGALRASIPLFALSLPVIGVAAWAASRRVSVEAVGAGTLALALLLGPNTHPYDMGLVLPALAWATRDREPALLVLPFVTMLPAFVLPSFGWRLAMTTLVVGTLLAWAWRVTRQPEDAHV